jgi:hypothetical protein
MKCDSCKNSVEIEYMSGENNCYKWLCMAMNYREMTETILECTMYEGKE